MHVYSSTHFFCELLQSTASPLLTSSIMANTARLTTLTTTSQSPSAKELIHQFLSPNPRTKLRLTNNSKQWLPPHSPATRTTATTTRSVALFSRYSTRHSYIINVPSIENGTDSNSLLAVSLLSTRQTSNSLSHSSFLTKSTQKTEALSFTVPHTWTVTTSIRLVQLSQKATLTKVHGLTTSKMTSRSA